MPRQGRSLPTADVCCPVAQLMGQLSGAECEWSVVAALCEAADQLTQVRRSASVGRRRSPPERDRQHPVWSVVTVSAMPVLSAKKPRHNRCMTPLATALWPTCGQAHLAQHDDGALVPTPAWWRHWLARPAIALVADSCRSETAQHRRLQQEPMRAVARRSGRRSPMPTPAKTSATCSACVTV
jgi:hypothetical protein